MAITELWLGRSGLFMVILCGFKSCHPHAKQFPSLSLQQQKQIMPLSTLYYGNLIEATKDELDEEKGSRRNSYIVFFPNTFPEQCMILNVLKKIKSSCCFYYATC